MSRCGKTGGIPKKFHTAMKEEWGKAEETGQGAYFTWISKAWKNTPPEKKAEYNKNRPLNKNAKAGICKKKDPPMWKNNVVGRTWIKNWMTETNKDPSVLKRWDILVRTKGRKNGLRKTKLSKEEIYKFVATEFGATSNAALCLNARMNKAQCRGNADVLKNGNTWLGLFGAGKWKVWRQQGGQNIFGFAPQG